MKINNVDWQYAGFNIVSHASEISEGRKGTAAFLVTDEAHKTVSQYAFIQSD